MKYSRILCLSLAAAVIFGTNLSFGDEPAPDAATLKRARDAGLKPEVRKGVTVYCWEDADIGTRFKTKKCVEESRLNEIIEAREAQREQLKRGGGNYGSTR